MQAMQASRGNFVTKKLSVAWRCYTCCASRPANAISKLLVSCSGIGVCVCVCVCGGGVKHQQKSRLYPKIHLPGQQYSRRVIVDNSTTEQQQQQTANNERNERTNGNCDQN